MTRDVLNRRPIILNCFARGGSNILWNYFLSHPACCSPNRETVELFRLGRHGNRPEGLAFAAMTRQPRYFDPWNLSDRRPISDRAGRFLDRTLYRWKLKTLEHPEMRYRDEHRTYSEAEVAASRLVIKNNSGLVLLSDAFATLYPDATMFGLVRDPVPLLEGYLRRGIVRSVEEFADHYNRIAGRMLDDAERLPRYTIVRFEDLISSPRESLATIYAAAELRTDSSSKLRLKAKAHFDATGARTTAEFEKGRHYWLSIDEIDRMIDSGVNEHQEARLDSHDRERVLRLTRSQVSALGYA